MTLTSRREPSFDGAHRAHHAEADDRSHGHQGVHVGAAGVAAHAALRPSSLTRFVSTVQIVGSLLAVPVGLASAYSIYRANFSPEITCQNLRGNIISMLDKSVDAATRRMLVRRDVQAFEERCESVDPDAHAAFKSLLAAPQVATAPAAAPKLRAALPAGDTIRKVETKVDAKLEAKSDVRPDARPDAKLEAKAEPKPEVKAEPRTVAVAKPPVVPAQAAAAPEAVAREAGLSDARWLAAVREALVSHDPDRTDTAAAPEKTAPEQVAGKPPAAEPLVVGKTNAAPILLQPAWNVTPPPADAPALASVPSATPDTAVPRPPLAIGDHPVPPAPIPVSERNEAENKDGDHSRLSNWISNIPFVGRVIEPRGN